MEGPVSSLAVKIRPLEARDIDAILEIQTRSIEAAQWSRKDYEALARDAVSCLVAEWERRVAGFLVLRKLADEMEILNLAVAPAARRRGIASQLVREAMKWGEENGINRAHLEVRASNAAALEFYGRHKFHLSGKRPDYYRDPVEEAVLLTAAVSNE